MSANDGGPAFPVTWKNMDGFDVVEDGMTLRDWFAGRALAGLLAAEMYALHGPGGVASDAYAYADAMLAARDTNP